MRAIVPTLPASSPAKAGDPVRRGVGVNHDGRGLLDTPLSRGMTTGVLATVVVLALALAPAFAGTWKHEVVPNDGDVLTYSADGKIQFYLGCGRGFALHVKYPGEAKQEGEADIAIATSKGRMTFNGDFEDPDVFGGTDFRQSYLGYLHSDPRVFGKKWNAVKARLLNMLDSNGPITISAGGRSYRLPAIEAGDWHQALDSCKN
jgi:hypothetical protein